MSAAGAAGLSDNDPIFARLEEQIDWYDRKSMYNQRMFKRFKVAEIVAAALIPFLAALHLKGTGWNDWITGITAALGVMVTVLEGLLHLNQYQQNWITYRSTCEALKHEKYLYLGKAGPYVSAKDPHSLLAERIESQVSQEHAKWASVQQQEQKKNG